MHFRCMISPTECQFINQHSAIPAHKQELSLQVVHSLHPWLTQGRKGRLSYRPIRRYQAILNLLLSGQVETNPGPRGRRPRFPCGSCDLACRWGQRAIQCDECDTWYHTSCINITSKIFAPLSNTSLVWICCQCGLPNFSTSLFDTTIVSNNSFDALSCDRPTHNDLSSLSLGPPLYTSSPKREPQINDKGKSKIQALVINFQSLLAKREVVWDLIEDVKPDIIFGTETWLRPDINTSEVFPPNFVVYRRDRGERGYGGTLLAVNKNLVSERIMIDDCGC